MFDHMTQGLAPFTAAVRHCERRQVFSFLMDGSLARLLATS